MSLAFLVKRIHVRPVAYDGALIASELGLRAHRDSALRAHLETRDLDDPKLQAILIPPRSLLQGFTQLGDSIASLQFLLAFPASQYHLAVPGNPIGWTTHNRGHT